MKESSHWSEEEDAIIFAHPDHTARQVAAMLPRRSWKSVQARRRRMLDADRPKPRQFGVEWTPEEDDALRAMSAQGMSFRQIAEVLNRPRNGVKNRMSRLNAEGAAMSFSEHPEPKRGEWPDLGPNAFQDIKLTKDTQFVQNRPQDRTLAGVSGELA